MAVKASIYNQEGKIIKELELNPKIFGVEVKPELVHQAVVTQQANIRQVLAHTKDRSEVRGGGAKPWRQKGTGRARHGSIRSPIWVGGGVVFGPRKDRNFKKMMNKKAKRKSLLMVLSDRAKESKVIVLDDLKLLKLKTKNLLETLKKLPIKEKKILLILPTQDEIIIKSARNLPKIQACQANNLNIIDVLKAEYIVILKEALKKIEETYLKSKK